jgi:acyl-CoA thioesterase I
MKIFVFGDSVTQGFHDAESGGWVNRLAAHFINQDLKNNFSSYNPVFGLGISGERVNETLARIENELKFRLEESEANLIILAVGINDSTFDLINKVNVTPIDVFSKRYSDLIMSAKKHGEVCVLGLLPLKEEILNPIPWFANHAYLSIEAIRFDEEIERLANEHEVDYVQMSQVFSSNLDNYLTDGIHPNTNGHKLIFSHVLNLLQKLYKI